MIIPSDILKNILHKIETDIKSHARLKLCEDPETNIWSYYGTIKLTPIVLEDYLMLILTVPLVDQSLHMNLYKVQNLPMLHLTLHVHVQYEIEGSYLATVMDGMFMTLPTALDVRLCLMMNGHLCMFNQVLYPVEHTNWCIYALFINDKEQIEKNPDHIPDLHWKLANTYHTTSIGCTEPLSTTVAIHHVAVETISNAKSNKCGEWCGTVLNTKTSTSQSK